MEGAIHFGSCSIMNERVIIVFLICASFLPANVRRVGVFISSNNGLSTEEALRYTAKDASDMAEVMLKYGSFTEEHIYKVHNKSVDHVLKILEQVSQKVAVWQRDSLVQSLFLVYYSGHGSSDALHINKKKLYKQTLLAIMHTIPADLKVLVLDACESGGFTRVKGRNLFAKHSILAPERLENRGTVILTSSAQNEYSRESSKYKGSVFTHHFINGVRGMADYDEDGDITLWEAFKYAHMATQSEQMWGQKHLQNPSFDMDVTGAKPFVISKISKGNTTLILKNLMVPFVDIYKSSDGSFITRIVPSKGKTAQYILPKGNYALQTRINGKVKNAYIDLQKINKSVVEEKDFAEVAPAEGVFKGALTSIRYDLWSGVHYMKAPHNYRIGHYWVGLSLRQGNMRHKIGFGGRQYQILTSQVHQHNLSLGMFYGLDYTWYKIANMGVVTNFGGGWLKLQQKLQDARLQHIFTADSTAWLTSHMKVHTQYGFLQTGVLLETFLGRGCFIQGGAHLGFTLEKRSSGWFTRGWVAPQWNLGFAF
jgi:hypothetical protein